MHNEGEAKARHAHKQTQTSYASLCRTLVSLYAYALLRLRLRSYASYALAPIRVAAFSFFVLLSFFQPLASHFSTCEQTENKTPSKAYFVKL